MSKVTYIYLNYGEMKIVIGMLNNYAEDAAKAGGEVRRINDENNGAGDVSSMANWDGLVAQLTDKAKEIDARVELAKAQSESGITSKSGDLIAYDLPDNVDDTIDNIQSATQGMKDAEALKQAGEKARTDRSEQNEKEYQEILKNIRNKTINPTYARAFVKIYGVENTIKLSTLQGGYELDDSFEKSPIDEEGINLPRQLLSQASQTWDSTESKNMADAIRSFIGDPGGRTTRFNALMSGDQKYGKDFLINLAKNFENIPWDKKLDTPERLENIGAGRSQYYSTDPMVGIMKAMANTPEAALDYLVPEKGADIESIETDSQRMAIRDRIYNIMNRHRAGNDPFSSSWTDSWASIIADVSNASKTKDPLLPDNSTRSALLSAAGISWAGDASELSEKSRKNLANVMKNHAWSIDQAANTDINSSTKKSVEINPGGSDAQLVGLVNQPVFNREALSKVLGLISENENDYNEIVEEVAKFNSGYLDSVLHPQLPMDRSIQLSKLETASHHSSGSQGFLLGAQQGHLEKKTADADECNRKGISLIASFASFVPGLGSGAGAFANAMVEYSKSKVVDAAKEKSNELFANNAEIVEIKNAEVKDYLMTVDRARLTHH